MPEGSDDKQTADSKMVASGVVQSGSEPPQVFISYASADSAIANAVCVALERENVKCWIAPRDVTPGELYATNIVHAIDTTQVLVLVLSKHAADSAHVLREIERASSKRHPIVSFRIDLAPLPEGLEYFLNTSQWLDASITGVRRALPRLVDAVRNLLAKRAGTGRVDQAAPVNPKASQQSSYAPLALAVIFAAALAYFMADKFWLSKHVAEQTPSVEATIASPSFSPSPDLPFSTRSDQKSIAVLPFVDMSPARDHAYLADGISDEILHSLSELPALHVIARTSSFSFRDTDVDVSDIAKKLNVTHILEGSLRKSGKQIRVTAQLIDANTAAQIWSEAYNLDERDFLNLQTDIAKSVASALAVTFGADASPKRTGSANAEAHELYLQGLYFWNRAGPDDMPRARDYFERAIVLDPSYATAWASIAGVYRALIYDGQIGLQDGLSKQGRAVQRALTLEPGLAAAHLKAGHYFSDIGDEAKAKWHIDQAVLLAPDDPQVLRTNAGNALDTGDINQAIQFQSRAVAVDPLSARSRTGLASFLVATERWTEAQNQIAKALELSPKSLELNAERARIFVLQRKFEDAQAAAVDSPEGPRRDQCLALLYYSTGKTVEADEALARLISATQRLKSFAVEALYAAEVYAYRGADNDAFQWLERAKRQAMHGPGAEPGWEIRMQMRLSPFLKGLHADGRWEKLVGKPWKT